MDKQTVKLEILEVTITPYDRTVSADTCSGCKSCSNCGTGTCSH